MSPHIIILISTYTSVQDFQNIICNYELSFLSLLVYGSLLHSCLTIPLTYKTKIEFICRPIFPKGFPNLTLLFSLFFHNPGSTFLVIWPMSSLWFPFSFPTLTIKFYQFYLPHSHAPILDYYSIKKKKKPNLKLSPIFFHANPFCHIIIWYNL